MRFTEPGQTLKKFATIFLVSLCFLGCSAIQTITPARVRSQTSSFDASTPKQYSDKSNSGVLTPIWDDKEGAHGRTAEIVYYAVTRNFLLYIQSLAADYGDQISPPIKPASDPKKMPGVSPFLDQFGNHVWKIDREHFDHYRQMSLWKKSNRPKTGMFTKLFSALSNSNREGPAE